MMDEIIVELKKKHFYPLKSIDFFSARFCPLALAIKEKTGATLVKELVNYADVDGQVYEHDRYTYENMLSDADKALKGDINDTLRKIKLVILKPSI